MREVVAPRNWATNSPDQKPDPLPNHHHQMPWAGHPPNAPGLRNDRIARTEVQGSAVFSPAPAQTPLSLLDKGPGTGLVLLLTLTLASTDLTLQHLGPQSKSPHHWRTSRSWNKKIKAIILFFKQQYFQCENVNRRWAPSTHQTKTVSKLVSRKVHKRSLRCSSPCCSYPFISFFPFFIDSVI